MVLTKGDKIHPPEPVKPTYKSVLKKKHRIKQHLGDFRDVTFWTIFLAREE